MTEQDEYRYKRALCRAGQTRADSHRLYRRYILGCRNPLIVSSVGDGSINGFADTFFQLAARDGLEIDRRMVTRKLGAATAVTVH